MAEGTSDLQAAARAVYGRELHPDTVVLCQLVNDALGAVDSRTLLSVAPCLRFVASAEGGNPG